MKATTPQAKPVKYTGLQNVFINSKRATIAERYVLNLGAWVYDGKYHIMGWVKTSRGFAQRFNRGLDW